MEQKNELELYVEQNKIDNTNILSNFGNLYQEARQIVEEVKDIVVTDESQKDLMQKARENRLKLQKIRVNADKIKTELKAGIIRDGRAIDGINNLFKALIIPVEEKLEKQEKFAENIEKERIEKQFVERVEKLSKYVSDVSLYNIKEMADEVFENLLSGCKTSWETAQENQRIAEEKEKKDREEESLWQKRQIELAPLWDYIQVQVTSKTPDDEYNKIIEQAKSDKKGYEDNQEKIRLQNLELQKKADDEKAKEQAEENLRKKKKHRQKKKLMKRQKLKPKKSKRRN